MLLSLMWRRISLAILTLASVATLIYLGIALLPGDAAQAALGTNSGIPALLEAERHRLGLDQPLLVRFGGWIVGLFRGDFGTAIPSGQPVWDLISANAANSAVLALIAMIVVIPLSFVLGVLSALRRGRATDNTITTATLALISSPEFVIGALLAAFFAGTLHVLPSLSLLDSQQSIFSQLSLLVLPAMTLVLAAVAQGTRMIRAAAVEVLDSNYIHMAILRGVPRHQIIRRHLIPNALGPSIQVFAFILAYMVGGIVVTETVFSYPGIGVALLTSVNSRDIPTVTAIALLLCTVFIAANLTADLANLVLNPKFRRNAR